MNKAYTQPGKDNIMEIIKLESDSEDAQTVEKNRNSEIQNQKQEIINLDENVENTKSNSQSSISTSASRGNLPLNKPNIQVKNESNNSSLFTISQRTKRILERINEKNKKAKLLNQFNQNKENENNIDKNVFIGRKTRSKEPNSADKKVKEKKIKLSMKTKEVIKKLKDIRNNRFDNINNDESKKPTIRKSSFSNLHIKYETLLQPSRELRLPISYKKILDSFIVLDRTLNRSKLSTNKSYNNFGNIKNLIESYTHRNFTIETLKQILYIVPHFYIMKYINVNNLNISTLFSMNGKTDKNHDLMIDIPNDFNERINKNYPKNFNFLDINFYKDESTYQPLVGNLNEKELTQRKNIFTNILNHIVNDFHNKFLKEKNDIIQPTKGKQSPANKFVSQELLQKIRAKEREKKIINEISDYNLYHNLQTDKIKVFKYLLLQIKTLLMTHNKSMELNELSELILNSNIMFKDFFEEKQKLNQEIIKFCQRNKGFININKHSTLGLMVVLENSDFVISDNLANIKI